MKKNLIFWSSVSAFLMLLLACQEDEPELEPILTPSNLVVNVELVGADEENPFGDGSGFVDLEISADNAISYQVSVDGDVRSAELGTFNFRSDFNELGINTYTITAIATGAGGVTSSELVEVEVFFDFQAPEELLQKLRGDGSKTWRIKAEQSGHFGLGPIGGVIPSEFFGAGPNEKEGVGMYDDRYVFDDDGTLLHITDIDTEDNTGTVFGRDVLIEELNGPVADLEMQGADVLNYPYNDVTVDWSITAPDGKLTINLTGTGFFGYYIGGNHSYEIFDNSVPNELVLRSTDGNGEFDWWFIITSDAEGEATSNTLESRFTALVWSDEFDTDGAPNPENWTYDLGTGDNGWGNGESQSYTSDAENVIVADGNLKITAMTADGGNSYTSARIKSEGIQEFTYGRAEARAKLPTGGGTWPAIWMLGGDYITNPWPAAGELDIMEHVGNQQDVIFATTHDPNNFAGNGRTGSISVDGVSDEFHIYEMEWTETQIQFAVDGNVFHTVTNDGSLPFNKDFFFIMNVAMGGNFGGDIDPDFTQSSMEVDYIRMYQ